MNRWAYGRFGKFPTNAVRALNSSTSPWPLFSISYDHMWFSLPLFVGQQKKQLVYVGLDSSNARITVETPGHSLYWWSLDKRRKMTLHGLFPPLVGKEWKLRGACKSYTYNVSKCCEPWNRPLFWKHEKNFSLVYFASFGDFVLRPYPCLRPPCSCSAQLPMDKVVRVPIHKSIRQMTQFIAMTRLCVFGRTGWTGWVDYRLLQHCTQLFVADKISWVIGKLF